MKTLILALVLMLSPIAARAEWRPPTWQESTLILASTALIVLDIGTSIDANHRGFTEINPLVRGPRNSVKLFGPGDPHSPPQPTPPPTTPNVSGNHPSTEKLVAMGCLGIASSVALWYILPSPWRNIFSRHPGAGRGR
jgi:hypothetical protein